MLYNKVSGTLGVFLFDLAVLEDHAFLTLRIRKCCIYTVCK